MRRLLASTLLACLACHTSPATSDSDSDSDSDAPPDLCTEANTRLGQHVCEQHVPDLAAWSTLSLPVDLIDQARTGKYMVPARADARLPALLLDVNTPHELHYKFLRSKMIVTGDTSHIDLPHNQRSGLKEAVRILNEVKGIGFVELNERDVVRHRLVRDIIEAYLEK